MLGCLTAAAILRNVHCSPLGSTLDYTKQTNSAAKSLLARYAGLQYLFCEAHVQPRLMALLAPERFASDRLCASALAAGTRLTREVCVRQAVR